MGGDWVGAQTEQTGGQTDIYLQEVAEGAASQQQKPIPVIRSLRQLEPVGHWTLSRPPQANPSIR